tara:strand:- start:632 stop:778 length:147 start_codon:yes stop_codon:yes gene_type:complete
MNVHQSGEFGKIKGNLQYLIRNCEDGFKKQTLQETKTLLENLYKELNK